MTIGGSHEFPQGGSKVRPACTVRSMRFLREPYVGYRLSRVVDPVMQLAEIETTSDRR